MKKRLLSAVIAGFMAASPVMAELTFSALSYRTGAYGNNGIPFADGYLDYFTLLQERDGGIGGESIRVIECETAYNTEKGVECYEATKGEGVLSYSPLSTGITYQLIPKVTADGIALHTMGYGRTSAKNGQIFRNVFNFPANYWDGASVGIKHLLDINNGDIKGKKIALVYHNSAYGKEPIRTLEELSKNLTVDIQKLEKTIFDAAGETFNLASPKQLGPILFDKLKLVDKPKKTKTGQYSTAEDVLSYLAKEHPIVSDILDWRSLKKLQNTYVDALPKEINPKTGRVHTIYNQAVAATGRLSSNNPNLQNIPIRTARGQQVRKAFVPRDDQHVLMAADYSQIELRIIAALSKDEGMLAAFLNNEDIHQATAAKVFNVPLEEVTRTQRGNAKTVNFGIIYGVSAFGLSQQTDLNRTEAKELIDTYYATYPKLRNYIQEQVDFARDNGYVTTVLGRRRYLKDINSQNAVVRGAAERNAVNAPIQGSAADIIKLAMIAIQSKLESENWKAKMLLQVHDELVFDVPKEEVEALQKMIKNEMENAFSLDVPLVVDMGIGTNWLEAH